MGGLENNPLTSLGYLGVNSKQDIQAPTKIRFCNDFFVDESRDWQQKVPQPTALANANILV